MPITSLAHIIKSYTCPVLIPLSSHLYAYVMLLELFIVDEAGGWDVHACTGVRVSAAAGQLAALPPPPKGGASGSLNFGIRGNAAKLNSCYLEVLDFACFFCKAIWA